MALIAFRSNIYPKIHFGRGKKYTIVIKSASSTGCYGFEYKSIKPFSEGGANAGSKSIDSGHKKTC